MRLYIPIHKKTELSFIALIILLFANTAFSKPFQFYGDYGLSVWTIDDSLHIKWFTLMPDTGMAKIVANDRVLDSTITSFDFSHHAVFPLPDYPHIDLHYGSIYNIEDQHIKTIYLEESSPPDYEFGQQDTILVIGDVHGNYDTLINLLIRNHIIDDELEWQAGHSHIVFTGDIFDRGVDVIKTLWFIYKLERQAFTAGGRVHLLLGNHEIMIFTHDVRYTAGKEQMIAEYFGEHYTRLFDLSTSILGKWLAQKPGIVKIDPFLFTHGGIDSRYIGQSIESINQQLKAFLKEPVFPYLLTDSLWMTFIDSSQYVKREDFFFGPKSLFWHREYVNSDTLENELDRVLDFYNASAMVIGHTALHQIDIRYNGKLFAVDLQNPASEMLGLFKNETFHAYRIEENGTKTRLTILSAP